MQPARFFADDGDDKVQDGRPPVSGGTEALPNPELPPLGRCDIRPYVKIPSHPSPHAPSFGSVREEGLVRSMTSADARCTSRRLLNADAPSEPQHLFTGDLFRTEIEPLRSRNDDNLVTFVQLKRERCIIHLTLPGRSAP